MIRIDTRGVKGAELALHEFVSGLDRELLNVLQPFADDIVSKMQRDAPVDTGYLRQHIRRRFPDSKSIAVNSWAPYSGFVDGGTFRMQPRPFFTRQVEQSPAILNKVFAQASINYLRSVIAKHQNGP